METAAQRRTPGFARDYLCGRVAREQVRAENRARLDSIKLRPRYLVDDAGWPDPPHSLLGTDHPFRFGIAPLGRAIMFAPGAIGENAPAHAIIVLRGELRQTP